MDKIKKIIKKLNLFFGFAFWVYVGSLIFAFVSIFYSIFDNNVYDNAHFLDTVNMMTFGMVEFEFSKAVLSTQNGNRMMMILSLCISFLSLLLVTYCISLVRKVFKSVLDDNLFCDEVVSNITELGYVWFVSGTLTNVASYIDYQVFIHSTDFDSLFLSDKIVDVTTSFTFDYSFILIFAIIYLFSLIFKYGVELQKLSDETL